MRGQTKIAVAIGAVLVVGGIWYAGKSDKPDVSSVTVPNKPVADKPANAQPAAPVTVAAADRRETSSSLRPVSEPVSSSGVASPAPRRIEETTSALSAGGEAVRPQPAETHPPIPAMSATELPGERAGLSSVVPNVATNALERAAAEPANDDVPHNADKDVKPAAPVLPPAPTMEFAASNSTTRPAAATPAPVTGKPAVTVPKVTTPAQPQPLPATVSAKPIDKPGAATDKPAEKGKGKEHVVQAGETYSSIAVKYFGNARYKTDIMKANPKWDPKKLYVGAKLVIPEAPAGATPATVKPAGKDGADVKAGNKPETAAGKAGTKSVVDAKPGTKVSADAKTSSKPPVKEPKQSKEAVVPPADPSRSYTVQPGEGWYDLARKFMGDGKNYPELYEYNKERVGGDPHLLRAGTVIELPPKAKLPAKTSSPSSRPAK